MTNEDVIDLYSRVKMGTIVVVLGPKQDDSRIQRLPSAVQTRKRPLDSPEGSRMLAGGTQR